MNDLFSIYGARKSKDGKRINVSIVTGKDENKVFGTISRKLKKGTTELSQDGKSVILTIKMLG